MSAKPVQEQHCLPSAYGEQARFHLALYHGGGCPDGFTAAWVALRSRGGALDARPCVHGDPTPAGEGRALVLLDFCLPRAALLDLRQQTTDMLVLDHHWSAAQDCADIPFCLFDMERSGAGLAWDHFVGEQRPRLVDFVEDRDLGRFAFGERTWHYTAYLAVQMHTLAVWESIANTDPEEIIGRGRPIHQENMRRAESLCHDARFACIPDAQTARPVILVQAPPAMVAEVNEWGRTRWPDRPVVCWSLDDTRSDCYCSIRTRNPGLDVSTIARLFGGGGHRHAAGFRVPRSEISAWLHTLPGARMPA